MPFVAIEDTHGRVVVVNPDYVELLQFDAPDFLTEAPGAVVTTHGGGRVRIDARGAEKLMTAMLGEQEKGEPA